MKKELTRRDMLGRAGVAIGGALAFGVLQSCSDDASDPPPQPPVEPPVDTTPQVADFPYEKHLANEAGGFQLDVATLKQGAYAAYFQGGCCHGAYSALLTDLRRAGAPFTSLPLAFGKFGGGGIDGFGSICGAALGAVLILNTVIEDAANRKKLVTELLRWYERTPFPAYVPTTNLDPVGKTLRFPGDDSALPVINTVVPGNHLCHVSVSTWCHANGDVDANGADKKSRCARLTADVAGKAAELMNTYLATAAYGARTAPAAAAIDGNCLGCHDNSKTPAKVDPVVATGMECTSCHTSEAHVVAPLPSDCTGCHPSATELVGFPPTRVGHSQ